jgi:hypothetical protein
LLVSHGGGLSARRGASSMLGVNAWR